MVESRLIAKKNFRKNDTTMGDDHHRRPQKSIADPENLREALAELHRTLIHLLPLLREAPGLRLKRIQSITDKGKYYPLWHPPTRKRCLGQLPRQRHPAEGNNPSREGTKDVASLNPKKYFELVPRLKPLLLLRE